MDDLREFKAAQREVWQVGPRPAVGPRQQEAWGPFVVDGGLVRFPCEAIWVTAVK